MPACELTRKVAAKSAAETGAGRGFLDGQMLIATPGMRDERFARSVIYMCAHSSEGAMGIVVNQPAREHQLPRPAGEARRDPGDRPDPASAARRRREGAQGRAGRNRARLRAALRRLLHRELDPADRRRHLPHRDARHPQGDRARQRTGKRDPRARLCRLGAGPARERDPAERLAALQRRSGTDLRHRHRARNTTRRCRRSASIPACCRAKSATPDRHVRAPHRTGCCCRR